MSAKVEKIVAQALELSPQARAFVAEKIIESLDVNSEADLSPAWREEIRRRAREVEEELVDLRDATDVFDKARDALELKRPDFTLKPRPR